MRKILVRLSCVISLFVASLQIGAQERVISESDFVGYKNQAFNVLRDARFRETRTIETKEPDSSVWLPFTIYVIEWIKPNRMYSRLTDVALGQTRPSTERIQIDDKRFVKFAGREWQIETETIRSSLASVSSTPEKSIPLVEYKLLPSEKLFGKIATVVQKTHIQRDKHNGIELVVTNLERNWFDESGRFLKQEFLTVKPPQRSMRQTIVYEYDPSIRIEAPLR